MDNNKFNVDPERKIHLIISDLTRREDSDDDRRRGLDFAALLAEDPDWDDIPVLMYAHTRESLEKRYAPDPLPPNVVNRPGKSTIVHRHFVEEVVAALDAIAANE
jgi:hypothetical protein